MKIYSTIENENLYCTQFHPEKSQSNGLHLIYNFKTYNVKKEDIFTLLYNDGYFVQSRNFNLQNVGNADW